MDGMMENEYNEPPDNEKTEKKESSKADDELLADARKAFSRSESAENHNRINWLDDVRFARLGEQWPEAVKQAREREGRPCMTVNRLPTFIKQVTNDARQNSPAIKFHPVGDGADQATAKVLDGLTRNIEQSSNASVAYDNALENAVTGGFGYFRVVVDYACDDVFDLDIAIEPIKNPLTVYGDPMSSCADSSDWEECFVTEMWTRSAFKRKWPDADPCNFEAPSHDIAPGWYEGDDIRVCEWWTREEVPTVLLLMSNGNVMHEKEYTENKDFFDVMGITEVKRRPSKTYKVTQRIITGNEILETNDWPGKFIPIVPVYGDEVMVDGERFFLSMIRFAKDPQQMFNYWRTVATELVALAPKAPWVGAVGSFATAGSKWATANTETHQFLEYDVVHDDSGNPVPPPQRQPFAGVPAGAVQEAMNASDDMKSVMGLYDASLGAKSNETSGKAILARQREGDVSTFNFTDNLSRGIRHAGRIICDLIPKVYSTERIIRVIGEDGSVKNIPVNGAQPPAMPAPQDAADAQKQQEEMQAIARVYSLTTGKYDVTVETGPSYTTKREEAANQMMEFIRADPAAAPLLGDLLAKNLDWPGADEIASRLKAMLPPQAAGQNPQMQQAQQQMQQMQHAIDALTQKLQQAGQDKEIEMAKVRIDAAKAQTDQFKADTDRMQVTAPAMSPEQIQLMVMDTIRQVLGGGQQGQQVQGPTPEQVAMAQQAANEQAQQQPQPQQQPPFPQ
jgi:hypothetical protein